MVVSSAPSRPGAVAKVCRDASTGAGSGACFKPTEPIARVEKPCTRPGSSASSGTCSAAGVVVMARRLRTARAEDLLDLLLDPLQVHGLAIDRGKPDVSELGEDRQPVHHHLADLPARDLDAARAPELCLDVVDDGAKALRRDVTLLGRLLQAGEELLRIEVLAASVLLGDEERDRLDPFIRGESLPALKALTPAPNGLPDLRVARVDDLQVVMTAVRAAH